MTNFNVIVYYRAWPSRELHSLRGIATAVRDMFRQFGYLPSLATSFILSDSDMEIVKKVNAGANETVATSEITVNLKEKIIIIILS